jgi:L-2-hydroxyglutarate oxidase LhgO
MEKTKIAIIGAGVVGLAIAARLSEKYDNILIVERHNSFGNETSSRNSEVIHAGIYYPANSLKGKLCLSGNEMMYDLCRNHNIPHVNCGKLIVATEDNEIDLLPELLEKAKANGAKGVRIVNKKEISEIEPQVSAKAAIYCPTSGVVDSHSLMKYFEATAINNGASFAYNNYVINIEKATDSYLVHTQDSTGYKSVFQAEILINSAGLHSDKICEMLGIDTVKAGYKINYHKGIYYRVNHKTEIFPKALIYPLPPEEGSVGIHTCPDIAGGMRLGPHFIWSDSLDYSVDDKYYDLFFKESSKYLPFLEPEDISVDSSGFMAAVQTPGGPMADFIIKHEEERGLHGFINLVGIESPGLTASPAIAELVEKMI